jgi:hypothetical protein
MCENLPEVQSPYKKVPVHAINGPMIVMVDSANDTDTDVNLNYRFSSLMRSRKKLQIYIRKLIIWII